MKLNIIKIVLLAIIGIVCHWSLNILLGISNDFLLNIWSLISTILVLITLFLLRKNITAEDSKAIFYLFTVYFVIGHFNILTEAYVFNVLDLSTTIKELARGLIMSLVISFLAVKFLTYESPLTLKGSADRHLLSWMIRISLVIVLYILFYILAGMLVQGTIAEFMDFYQDRVPPLDVILKTQVFRGLIFALIIIFLSRIFKASFVKSAIITGLAFSILGALAPLITPNEHMPQSIRVIHSFEVGITNFFFGVLAYLILGIKEVHKTVKK